MERKHHRMTVDLEANLQKPDEELMFLDRNGRPMDAKEARRELARAFGKGYDVLPVCDNPDARGYCNCDPDALPCKCGREDFPRGMDGQFCGACGSPVLRKGAAA